MEAACKQAEQIWKAEYKGREDEIDELSPVKKPLTARQEYEKEHLRKGPSKKKKDEWQRFIEDQPTEIDCTALEWWLEPSQRRTYPDLFHMAVDILSIDPMSAEAERVFSGGRRTVGWERASMSSMTLEQTECLKHWCTSGWLDEVR
jgi:hypothetical protein